MIRTPGEMARHVAGGVFDVTAGVHGMVVVVEERLSSSPSQVQVECSAGRSEGQANVEQRRHRPATPGSATLNSIWLPRLSPVACSEAAVRPAAFFETSSSIITECSPKR